jgi:hypothetical protein
LVKNKITNFPPKVNAELLYPTYLSVRDGEFIEMFFFSENVKEENI